MKANIIIIIIIIQSIVFYKNFLKLPSNLIREWLEYDLAWNLCSAVHSINEAFHMLYIILHFTDILASVLSSTVFCFSFSKEMHKILISWLRQFPLKLACYKCQILHMKHQNQTFKFWRSKERNIIIINSNNHWLHLCSMLIQHDFQYFIKFISTLKLLFISLEMTILRLTYSLDDEPLSINRKHTFD